MHPRIKPHPGKNTNPYSNAIVGLLHTDAGGTKSLVEENKELNGNPAEGLTFAGPALRSTREECSRSIRIRWWCGGGEARNQVVLRQA